MIKLIKTTSASLLKLTLHGKLSEFANSLKSDCEVKCHKNLISSLNLLILL